MEKNNKVLGLDPENRRGSGSKFWERLKICAQMLFLQVYGSILKLEEIFFESEWTILVVYLFNKHDT